MDLIKQDIQQALWLEVTSFSSVMPELQDDVQVGQRAGSHTVLLL